jgi:pimeloyl-ACP methyl ester carboxylesterase
MHRNLQTVIVPLSLLFVYGFTPFAQVNSPTIMLLDRAGQTTSQITDGNTVQIQITLPQAATQETTINFSLEGVTPVGSCVVAVNASACATESFSALGWYWGSNGNPQNAIHLQASNNSGEIVAQSDVIMIKPRPVVMVHGFISNAETWKPYLGANGFLAPLGIPGFAIGDGQVPGKLNTGEISNPVGRTNTIGQNAGILGQYIANVKQKTGAEMVDLVVHSMGGMISRYYIDRMMQERDVAQLIMLGSPMGGSDCAVLPAALGFFLPASIEIRQSYMTGVFNQQITRRHGIEFYDLGGTAISESFKSPCTDIPNDTVVSFSSINAITLQSSQIAVIHSDLTLADKAFQDFVKPLLQKPAGTFLSTPDPAAPPHADSPLDFTRVYTGHVDSGGSTELTISIEPGLSVASFALYDASRSVTTVVRGASGNIIELTPETNGFIRVTDPSTMFYLGYGFQNPLPGPWQITVQATESTPASGADFAISVYFMGGAKLEAASSTLVPQINEQVRLDAGLSLGGQSLEIKEARAVIKDADGNVETLDFPSGQNVSTIWTPTKAGTYAVDVVVTGLAPDGTTVERTDFLAIEVQPNPSKGQITFNLVAVIAGVLLVLFLILRFVFRGTGKIVRRIRN